MAVEGPADPALRRSRLPVAILLVAVVATFSPALFGNYAWDDTHLIAHNGALLRSDLGALLGEPLFGMQRGFWRPITLLVLWVGHQLGGAFGVHLLALLLHGGNCVLVLGLARRWLLPWPALWVALLFALHPVQVESVAWCAAINDPLWVLFALLAIGSAVRWRDRGSRGLPWATAGCVLASLLCKETGIATVPLVLAGMSWLPGDGRDAVAWRRLLVAIGVALLVWIGLRTAVVGAVFATVDDGGEAVAPMLSTWVLFRHLALLLWPLPLHPFRAVPTVPVAATVMLAFAAVGVLFAARRWLRRDPAIRFGLALILLPLLPPLLHVRAVGGHPVNDRYLYLSVAGLGLLLATRPWLRTWPRPWNALPWLVPLALGIGANRQIGHWHDDEQLARHALTHTPDDPTVLVLLADQELQQALAGDTAQWTAAREHYRRAVENTPAASNGVVRRTLSAGKLGLAWCLAFDPTRARPAPAQVLAAFEDAIAAGPENPAAWVGLGVARGMAGQDGPADEAFERALALDPDNSEAWCNRGYLHLQHRRFAAAADCLDRALRADPGNARARELRSQVPRAR